MRVYRKTSTQHPICVYLTTTEAAELAGYLSTEDPRPDWVSDRLFVALRQVIFEGKARA